MAATGVEYRAPTHEEVCARFAEWINRYSLKETGQMFPKVALNTIKVWRTGKLPEQKTWTEMVEMWGEDFLVHVYAPALVFQAEDELERVLDRINRDTALAQKLIMERKRAETPTSAGANLEGQSQAAGGLACSGQGASSLGRAAGRCASFALASVLSAAAFVGSFGDDARAQRQAWQRPGNAQVRPLREVTA